METRFLLNSTSLLYILISICPQLITLIYQHSTFISDDDQLDIKVEVYCFILTTNYFLQIQYDVLLRNFPHHKAIKGTLPLARN